MVVDRGALRVIVVTGCDRHHVDLAVDLLDSIAEAGLADMHIGFVHIGDEPVPDVVAKRVRQVATVPIGGLSVHQGEGFLVARLGIKARLPQLFPGYDIYIWLDADVWVQRVQGLYDIAAAAVLADIAVHPQLDPNYIGCLYPDDYTVDIYRRLYGRAATERLARRPMVNGGVFGACAASPLWALWRRELSDVAADMTKRPDRFFSDQIPLHRLIHTERLSVIPLRAVNNWLTLHSLPRFDPSTGLLTAPSPPHEPINLVHLVGGLKTRQIELGGRMTGLRYRDIGRLRQNVPSANLPMRADAPGARAVRRA
jgi:hypothetical protein